MANFDPSIEANLESKLIAVNKADMKLRVAKCELRDAVCEALISILQKDAEMDDILSAARTITVYQRLDKKDKSKVVKFVYEQLNS